MSDRPIILSDDQFGKWIDALHGAHETTANIKVDEEHTDSLAHNILHSTLIQVCVGLYHRLQDLEQQVEQLEKSTDRQSEKDNEWVEGEFMTRDNRIERLQAELHRLRDDHDYRINDVDGKLDRHTYNHPTGRGYY